MIPFERFLTALRPTLAAVHVGPIGIDLAAERINLVQTESGPGGQAIRAARSVAYPCAREALLGSPAAFRSFLREALRSRPFRGRRVVSCLPPAEVRILPVEFEATDGQDETAAVLRKVRERVREDLAGYVLDYLPIRGAEGSQGGRGAIAALARREQVVAHLDLLRAAGLEPQALDIGPAALARLVGALDADRRHPNVLLINFGRARSYLTVIWGRRLMLDREIDFGEDLLLEALHRQLDLPEHLAVRLLYGNGLDPDAAPEAEDVSGAVTDALRPEFAALAQEVSKTLIYLASRTHGSSVQQVFLMGSVARYPRAADFIGRLLEVPVSVLNPFAALPCRSDCAQPEDLEPAAGLALAAGLSLRGLATHA